MTVLYSEIELYPIQWLRSDKQRCDGISNHDSFIEPGTFPLAHRIAGRVGKLRAYGNAITPQIAETFIRAVIEG